MEIATKKLSQRELQQQIAAYIKAAHVWRVDGEQEQPISIRYTDNNSVIKEVNTVSTKTLIGYNGFSCVTNEQLYATVTNKIIIAVRNSSTHKLWMAIMDEYYTNNFQKLEQEIRSSPKNEPLEIYICGGVCKKQQLELKVLKVFEDMIEMGWQIIYKAVCLGYDKKIYKEAASKINFKTWITVRMEVFADTGKCGIYVGSLKRKHETYHYPRRYDVSPMRLSPFTGEIFDITHQPKWEKQIKNKCKVCTQSQIQLKIVTINATITYKK